MCRKLFKTLNKVSNWLQINEFAMLNDNDNDALKTNTSDAASPFVRQKPDCFVTIVLQNASTATKPLTLVQSFNQVFQFTKDVQIQIFIILAVSRSSVKRVAGRISVT